MVMGRHGYGSTRLWTEMVFGSSAARVCSSSMQLLFGIPIMTLGQRQLRKCKRQQSGGPAGDGTRVASAIC